MEPVRRYLGLYALFGAAVVVAGVAGLVHGPSLAFALLALGGLGMFAPAIVGFLVPDDYATASPPAWALVASPVGVGLALTGAGLALLA